MFRLTLRNLLARKLRLVMSGLAIVLGVAFLSGVLVFNHGLSATFDGIIYGTTPDGVVRAQDSAEFDAGYSGTPTAVLTPDTVADLEALPEVDRADGDVTGFGMNLLSSDGTVVGSTGAPTLAFNYHDGPNMAGRSILHLEDGALAGGLRPDRARQGRRRGRRLPAGRRGQAAGAVRRGRAAARRSSVSPTSTAAVPPVRRS